jgi:hypothetical protein
MQSHIAMCLRELRVLTLLDTKPVLLLEPDLEVGQ